MIGLESGSRVAGIGLVRKQMKTNKREIKQKKTAADKKFSQSPVVFVELEKKTHDKAIHMRKITRSELEKQIAELKRENHVLEESYEKYRVLFDMFPLGISITDTDGKIIETNRESERLLGISQEEHSLRKIDSPEWSIIRPDGTLMPPDEYASMRALKEKRKVENAEMGIVKGDGDVTWISVSAAPIPLENYGVAITYGDITERRRVAALNVALLNLIEYSLTHSRDELLEETINEAEKLSGSVIGFYHFVDEDQEKLTLQNWSTRTKAEFCKAEGKGLHYAIAKAGVWVDCVYQRKPVIHNDYISLPHRKGLPEGHAPVIRQLVVPVMRGEKVMAILGVGNKPTDYDQADIEAVSLLADMAWENTERKRMEEELSHKNEELLASNSRLQEIMQTQERSRQALLSILEDGNLSRKALHESEEKFSTAFRTSPYAITITCIKDGRFIEVNDAFTALSGYTREEVIADSSVGMNLWAESEEWNSVVSALLAGSEVATREFRFKRKNGEILTALFSAQIIHLGGEPFILSSINDITERKQAVEALQESEVKYRTLYETMVQGVVYQSADGTVISANTAAERILGLTLDQIQGRAPMDPGWKTIRQDGADFPEEEHPSMVALRTGKEVSGVVMGIFNPSLNDFRWTSINALPLFMDGENRPYQVYTTFTDITDLKAAGLKALYQLQFLYVIINAINVPIYFKDAEGRYSGCNKAFEGFAGVPMSGLIGMTVFDLWPGELAEGYNQKDLELLETGGNQTYEAQARFADGTYRHVMYHKSLFYDKNGKVGGIVGAMLDITDRKRAEEALRLKNLVFDASLTANSIADASGVITEANASFLRTWGYAGIDEVKGRTIASFFLNRDEAGAILAALNQTGEWEGDFTAKRKDRSVFLAHCLATVIRNDRGEVGGYQSSIIDVTDEREAVAGIEHLTKVLKAIRNVNQFIVREKDPARLIRQICELLIETRGYNGAWIAFGAPGAPPTAQAQAGWGERFEPLASRLAEGRWPRCRDIAAWAPDGFASLDPEEICRECLLGGEYNFDLAAVVCLRYEGRDFGMLGVSFPRDVSLDGEEKEILLEVAGDIAFALHDIEIGKQNLHYAQIVATSSEAMALIGPDKCHLEANPSYLRLIGRPGENIRGLTVAEVVGADFFERELRARLESCFAGEDFRFETTLPGPDARTIDALYAPCRAGNGAVTAVAVCIRDITERKRAENELAAYRDHLEELVRDRTAELEQAKVASEAANRSKTRFLSSMSHEIRTPLNAILGFSELLIRDRELTDTQRERMETVNRSGEHLLALINDVLEISKIEEGRSSINPAPFDLIAMLGDIEGMFMGKMDAKGLSFRIDTAGVTARYLVSDEAKLRQILINLVGNAAKFTVKGGVAIRARTVEEDDGGVVLTADVEDTGPGISETEMAGLFKVFEQGSAGVKAGGTGLGLAISRQFAWLMGGDITVRSKEGKGSCFTLRIAARAGESIAGKTMMEPRAVSGLEPGQGPFRVLVTDDQPDNRMLIREFLEPAGFEVKEACDGIEAIDLFKSWSPHLVLMDRRMPRMNGLEAMARIREIDPGGVTKIVMVTASAFIEDRDNAMIWGADAYLPKPFKARELFECLGSMLGVRYVYDEVAPVSAAPATPLTPGSLAGLSNGLAEKMLAATVELDRDGLFGLIGEITAKEPETGRQLYEMVKNYQYEALIELIKRRLEQNENGS